MTLSQLHNTKFGYGNWPGTADRHDVMDIMFNIADAELTSNYRMHQAFNRLQCTHALPRNDMMTVFKFEITKSARVNGHFLSTHQIELIAYALIAQWIAQEAHSDVGFAFGDVS